MLRNHLNYLRAQLVSEQRREQKRLERVARRRGNSATGSPEMTSE